MKSLLKTGLLIGGIVAFYSCSKEINVDVKDATPQLVIEGNITDDFGPYEVQITRTVTLSSPNVYPAVEGAAVSITDHTAGITEALIEDAPGVYKTSLLRGLPGHEYQLSATVDGKLYTASSTMPQPVILDSLTFMHTDIFGDENINVVPNYRDPVGIANYYTFNQYINSKRMKGIFVFDDRLSDGKYITTQLFADSTYLQTGDTVLLEMNCIDKPVWNYFNTLEQISDGGFGGVTPANPASNISNNALGYFSAHTIQTKKAIAK